MTFPVVTFPPVLAFAQELFGILLAVIAVFLILLVLVQRGRGGGLAGALGGMGGSSAFGAKAGDVFTRITIVAAAVWILLCIMATRWGGEMGSRVNVTGATGSDSGAAATATVGDEKASDAKDATASKGATDDAATAPAGEPAGEEPKDDILGKSPAQAEQPNPGAAATPAAETGAGAESEEGAVSDDADVEAEAK